METTGSVYRLCGILSDARYQGLRSPFAHFLQTVPRRRSSRKWRVRRVGNAWTTPSLLGRVSRFNDFPCVDLIHPAFSERAVGALRDLLEPNGELLPLKSETGVVYYAYNITTVADVLDRRRSKLSYLSDGITAAVILHHEFVKQPLSSVSIFRIPEEPYSAYVTDRFVRCANQAGLKGFDFQLVWPLPADSNWKLLAKAQRHLRHREGLPPGKTLHGNSVIIKLPTAGESPSAAEKARIRSLAREVSALLFDADSELPRIGNVEYVEYDAAGSGNIVMSCPDWTRLVAKIKPWLRAGLARWDYRCRSRGELCRQTRRGNNSGPLETPGPLGSMVDSRLHWQRRDPPLFPAAPLSPHSTKKDGRKRFRPSFLSWHYVWDPVSKTLLPPGQEACLANHAVNQEPI